MAQRRGDAAKQSAIATIQEAFGEGFVTYNDKKLYVNVRDGANGEVVQLAISITMPKVPIDATAAPPTTDPNAAPWEAKQVTPTELSAEDKEKVSMLMERLGL